MGRRAIPSGRVAMAAAILAVAVMGSVGWRWLFPGLVATPTPSGTVVGQPGQEAATPGIVTSEEGAPGAGTPEALAWATTPEEQAALDKAAGAGQGEEWPAATAATAAAAIAAETREGTATPAEGSAAPAEGVEGWAGQAETAVPEPTPRAGSSRGDRAPQRIGLQAGHWQSSALPAELSYLRGSTGAEGRGWRERDLNLDIARRTAAMLEAEGFAVDVLPSTVPEGYESDVFLALHADANADSRARGFKVARASRSAIPSTDDALVETIYQHYQEVTGLPRDDKNITRNMLYYYPFAGSRIKHAVAATTPAAILEMGFLSNPSDRNLLLGAPEQVARAVTEALIAFLNRAT